MLRIGPAGWAYKDWAGIVYPSSDSVSVWCQFWCQLVLQSRSLRCASLRLSDGISC
jgi:hypothetical protein